MTRKATIMSTTMVVALPLAGCNAQPAEDQPELQTRTVTLNNGRVVDCIVSIDQANNVDEEDTVEAISCDFDHATTNKDKDTDHDDD